MEKKEIAAIGDKDFTTGFQLAGIQKIYNPENYQETVQELLDSEKLGIIIAKQDDVQELPKRIQNQVQNNVDPVVVSLSQDAESVHLQEKIKKAIGADITQ
ncbi:MAG: V/A-type H+-transporting ATPase subunit F [Candidatus Nanohaloarchaea archaeon]|jgi:V/A-type H+-transporting ATPase subunit F